MVFLDTHTHTHIYIYIYIYTHTHTDTIHAKMYFITSFEDGIFVYDASDVTPTYRIWRQIDMRFHQTDFWVHFQLASSG